MDSKTIFTKTAKGLGEISGKTKALSRDLRNILKEVDGKSPFAELAEKVGNIPEAKLKDALTKLMADNYIREFAQPTLGENTRALDFSTIAPASPPAAPRKPAEPPHRRVNDISLNAVTQSAPSISPNTEIQFAEFRRLQLEEQARHEARNKANKEADEKRRREQEAKVQRELEEWANKEVGDLVPELDLGKAAPAPEPDAAAKAAEEAVRQIAAEEAKKQAELQARRQAEELAKREAETKAKLEAEAKARIEAEVKARIEAETRARVEAETKARLEAEAAARRAAEEQARKAAEELARHEAEARARKEAEEKARRAAEDAARKAAEAKAREEADAKARQEAEAKARKAAEDKARLEAEQQARRAAEEKARKEAEQAAKEAEIRAAAAKAKQEAEERARREAELLARKAAEQKQREAAEKLKAEQAAEIEELARLQEQEQARVEAEARAKKEAERAEQEKARKEAIEEARRKAAQVRQEAGQKIKRDAAEQEKKEAEDWIRREVEERERRAAEARGEPEEEIEPDEHYDDAPDQHGEAEQEEFVDHEPIEEPVAQAAPAMPAGRSEKHYRKQVNWIKPLVAILVIAIVAGVGLLHVISFDGRIPALEKVAGEQFGQPVKIKSLYVSLVPQPHWRIEGMSIGSEGQITAPKVKAEAGLGALFGGDTSFKSIELETPVISETGLGWLLFGKFKGSNVQFDHLRMNKAKLDSQHLALGSFDATATMGSDGAWKKIVIDSAENRLHLQMVPKGEALQVELSADSFKVPFGAETTLEHVSIDGTASRDDISLTQFRGSTMNGTLVGNAHLKRDGGWKMTGQVTATYLDAVQFAPLSLQAGKLNGDASFTAENQDLSKLLTAPRVEGNFSIRDGVLVGVDLASLLRNSNLSGKTNFGELSGAFLYDGGKLQFRNVGLTAGLLGAKGAIDMDQDKSLTGHFVVEIKSSSIQSRANLNVAGNLKEPRYSR